MTDDEFLLAVDDGREPSDHRGNLRLAWLMLQRHPRTAEARLLAALTRRARCSGGTVHLTRTAAWMALVRAARAAAPHARDLEELLALRVELVDRRVLERYYTPALLADPLAGEAVLAPDRAVLPGWRPLAPA